MIDLVTPMSRWKKSQPLDFVYGATERYNFVNWQTGNDDSVYYNLNIPSFFKTRVVMPPADTSVLERDLHPDLLNLTFNNVDGTTNPTLKEYLGGPKQVQAMMMAHKGKVVFDDGAMFKHGNNGQGIYVDPKRDFCAMGFGSAANTSGVDYAPGFMRAAAMRVAG